MWPPPVSLHGIDRAEVVPLKLSAESAGPSFPTGIITVMSALSVAPSKAWEYSKEGWEYLKERTK